VETLQALSNVGPLSIPSGQAVSPFLTPLQLGPNPQAIVVISPGALTGQVHLEAATDSTLSASQPIQAAAGGDIDAAGGAVLVPQAVLEGGVPWWGIRLVSNQNEAAQRDFAVWVQPTTV